MQPSGVRNQYLEIPTGGYILDLVVFYDKAMVDTFGNEARTRFKNNIFIFKVKIIFKSFRVDAAMAHAQVMHKFDTTPSKMTYNIIKCEHYDGYYEVDSGLW